MIIVSTIPNIIDTYQYIFNLNPLETPRQYMRLCDHIGNLTELMLSLFQIIGSIGGSKLALNYGYA